MSSPEKDPIHDPLAEVYPDAFERIGPYGEILGRELSLKDVCDELRKLYMRCCGFLHEIGHGKPCSDVETSFNVVCNHSFAESVYYHARCAGHLTRKVQAAERLFVEYYKIKNHEIDNIDFGSRHLYDITLRGPDNLSEAAPTALHHLQTLDIPTDAKKGETKEVTKVLQSAQEIRGKKMLRIRDDFLELLGA